VHEAIFRLLNKQFIITNVPVVERSLGPAASRAKILKDKKDLDKLPEDSVDLYKSNYLDAVYPHRPPQLEDASLHTLLTQFTIVSIPPDRHTFDDDHIQATHDPKKMFVRRREPYVFVCTNEASMFHDDVQKMRYIFQVQVNFA